jgi:cellobiose-specific phosphotransferase system component IIB
MKKLILFFVVLIALNIASAKSVNAVSVNNYADILKNTGKFVVGPKLDTRVEKLEKFLKNYNSPLADKAGYFVMVADNFNMDYRLVPAISGIESTFGKNIPQNSFNAYGWGNGKSTFDSWEESIFVVSKTLSEKYIAKGLDTPIKMSRVYCPPNPDWGRKVAYFMDKIEEFDEKDELNKIEDLITLTYLE